MGGAVGDVAGVAGTGNGGAGVAGNGLARHVTAAIGETNHGLAVGLDDTAGGIEVVAPDGGRGIGGRWRLAVVERFVGTGEIAHGRGPFQIGRLDDMAGGERILVVAQDHALQAPRLQIVEEGEIAAITPDIGMRCREQSR